MSTAVDPEAVVGGASIIARIQRFAQVLTDQGRAEQLAERERGRLLFVPAYGWLQWVPKAGIWRTCTAAQELGNAAELGYAERGEALRLQQEFMRLDPDTDGHQAAARLLRTIMRDTRESHMVRTMRNVLTRAGGMEGMHAEADQLDAWPELLNTPAGVYNLRAGDLHPHNAALLLTRMTTGAPGQADASAEGWHRFLDRVLPDLEVQGLMQRALGSALAGRPSRHFVVLYGDTTRNGKSTLLEAVRLVLGSYGQHVGAELFLQKRSDRSAGDESALAGTRGARFVKAAETDEHRRFSEAQVKALTGEARIQAKLMRKDMFEFVNQASFFLSCNHRPAIATGGEAIWDRMVVVPFDVQVPAAEAIDGLAEQLAAQEADGILDWLIAGWHDYLRRGLDSPPAVQAASSMYRAEEDYVDRWLEECCDDSAQPDDAVRSIDAWNSYDRFMRSHGRPRARQADFNDDLERRGFRRERARRGGVQARYFFGLKLQDSFGVTDAPAI